MKYSQFNYLIREKETLGSKAVFFCYVESVTAIMKKH